MNKSSAEQKYQLEKAEIQKMLAVINKDFKFNDRDINNLISSMDRIFSIELQEMGYCYGNHCFPKRDFDVNYNLKTNHEYFANSNICGFYCDKNKNQRPMIAIDLNKFVPDFQHSDFKIRKQALFDLMHTTFHELRHARQTLMMQSNVCNKFSLNIAREHVVANFARDWYQQNHDEILYENDAHIVGINQALALVDNVKDKDIIENYDAFLRGRMSTTVYNDKITLDDGTVFDKNAVYNREEVLVPMVDWILKKHPEMKFVERYPILSKEYYRNGTKKNAQTLYYTMISELTYYRSRPGLTDEERTNLTNDCREMYAELLYDQIFYYSNEEMDQFVAKLGKDKCAEILTLIDDALERDTQRRTMDSKNMLQAERKIQNYDWKNYRKSKLDKKNWLKGLKQENEAKQGWLKYMADTFLKE